MNENTDLMDLCRLNLMEEVVRVSSAVDRDPTMVQIDWAKRREMGKIVADGPSQDAVDRHLRAQI